MYLNDFNFTSIVFEFRSNSFNIQMEEFKDFIFELAFNNIQAIKDSSIFDRIDEEFSCDEILYFCNPNKVTVETIAVLTDYFDIKIVETY